MVAFRVCEFYLNLEKKGSSSLSPWRHLSETGYFTCSWGLGWVDTEGTRTHAAECPRREPAEPFLWCLGLRGGWEEQEGPNVSGFSIKHQDGNDSVLNNRFKVFSQTQNLYLGWIWKITNSTPTVQDPSVRSLWLHPDCSAFTVSYLDWPLEPLETSPRTPESSEAEHCLFPFCRSSPHGPVPSRKGRGEQLGSWTHARSGDRFGGREQCLPRWLSGKESACQCRRLGFHPWIRKIPWRRKWQPTPVFLPKKSHGQRSLAGYNPWSHRVRHDWLSTHACNNRERSKENRGERNIQWRIGRLKTKIQAPWVPSEVLINLSQRERMSPTHSTTCWKSLLREKHVDFEMTPITIEHLFYQRP